jgi:glutathione S-transferase
MRSLHGGSAAGDGGRWLLRQQCIEVEMITIWGMATSVNCWKVSAILRLTGQAFRWIETDTTKGETRTPDFLARNPAGQVPVVTLDDGTILTESNAILAHFAEATSWLPPPGLPRTQVMQWLFWEQYSHEPYIAVARNLITYRREKHLHTERLALCRERGERALQVMERRLHGHDWLTDTGPTIADIALYAYTHVADEGEFSLDAYPGVTAWVGRVGALPGIVGLR